VASTPTIDTMNTLGDSIQEATVTVTAETELEAHDRAWSWLGHHATKKSLVISVDRREGKKNGDGTITVRYF
jgi:hypothetical protein